MNKQERTSRIRASADGELDTDQEAELQHLVDSDDEMRSQLQFERTLRRRVDRAMRQQVPGAPEGLADRIRRELAAADMGDAEEPAAEVVVGRIGAEAGSLSVTSQRRWWAGGGFALCKWWW